MKYIQRFDAGNMIYLAFYNKVLFAEIRENKGFISCWVVINSNTKKQVEFSSLDSAKNFVETSAMIRYTK